jgi:hypothetical protein
MSLKQKILEKRICGRELDNEPEPMEGCNIVDCDRCKVRSKVTQYIAVDDVVAVIDDVTRQIQEKFSNCCCGHCKLGKIIKKEVLAVLDGEKKEVKV